MADRFERLEEDVDARAPAPPPQETWPDTGSFNLLFTAARQLIASNIDPAPKDLLRETLVERIYIVVDDQVTHRTSTSTQLRNFLDSLDRLGFALPEYRRNSFESYYRVLLSNERDSAIRDPWQGPWEVDRMENMPAVLQPTPVPDYLRPYPQDGDLLRDLADTSGLIYRRGPAPRVRGVVYPGDPTIYPVPRLQVPSFEIARPAPPAMPVFGEGIFGADGLLQDVQAPTFFEERDALPGGFNPWRDHPAEQNRATIEAEAQERLAALERRSGPRTQALLDALQGSDQPDDLWEGLLPRD